MSKSGSFWDNPFGGVFDFNKDGKEDFFERAVGYKILKDCIDKSRQRREASFPSINIHASHMVDDGFDEEDDDFDEDDDDSDEDDEDFDEDDETLELNLVEKLHSIYHSYSIENAVPDTPDKAKESDYPNKRRYNAAYTLAWHACNNNPADEKVDDCCRFILKYADSIPAADYLSHRSGFLYSQAVKDHFNLPTFLPDEDEEREYEFPQILRKIARRDVSLSFEVWSWCLAQFLPYAQYDARAPYAMTNDVLDMLYTYPQKYRTALVQYLDEHTDFRENFISALRPNAAETAELIVIAIQEQLCTTAQILFEGMLNKLSDDWKEILALVTEIIDCCTNYHEAASAIHFKEHMLPLLKVIDIIMVQDEIEEWEEILTTYIGDMKGLHTQYYCTREKEHRETVWDDTKIYTLYGVAFPNSRYAYSYRTEDTTIKIGDTVLVPTRDTVTKATVVSVGQYIKMAAPYPVEKTKYIIRKVEEETNK